jgi:hypothetical protein
MSGAAGSVILSTGVTGTQPPIGNYVEAPTGKTAANTNYIGVNSNVAYKTNVIGNDNVAGFTAPVNDNDATGGLAHWVQAAGTIAKGGTCTIAAGVATAGAGTYTCEVVGGVVANDYFWAVVTAES